MQKCIEILAGKMCAESSAITLRTSEIKHFSLTFSRNPWTHFRGKQVSYSDFIFSNESPIKIDFIPPLIQS